MTTITSNSTYTIAVLTSSGMLLACIRDSDDVEAVLRAAEATNGKAYDRAGITIDTGLTLTNSHDTAKTGEVRYRGFDMGRLIDEHEVEYQYAVRLPAPPTVYQCPDCDWSGTTDDIAGLLHLHHIDEHISAGELVPAGTCPECRAMIEVADADVPENTLMMVGRILRKRGWQLTAPDAEQAATLDVYCPASMPATPAIG